jgi:hypothetical protein
MALHLTEGVDKAKLGGLKGKFTVKAVYDMVTRDDMADSYSRIWKAKLPYKIKIFLWLVETKAILTKDNIIRRKWQGDPSCYFCDTEENRDHLLFQCPIARCVWGIIAICLGTDLIPNKCYQYWEWAKRHSPGSMLEHTFGLAAVCSAIWKARNKACFEQKYIKHPAEIVIHACALMKHWAGLYKKELQAQMTAGVGVFLAMASRLLAG